MPVHPLDDRDEDGPIGCEGGTPRKSCGKPVVVEIAAPGGAFRLCPVCAAALIAQPAPVLADWAYHGVNWEVGSKSGDTP